MALPSGFTEELRIRVPVAVVVRRLVRLARYGKTWKGSCPFHADKSPSFYVYDDHYHCYGCGAHGDAISFVMQSQGLPFMEAVNQLAAEAGLELPKPSFEVAEAERRRLDVVGVLAAVQAHYQRRLALPEGKPARDYLERRGLTDETIARFGLGWAGDRGRLTEDLSREGIDLEQLADAGLIRRDEETKRAFELFSQRVMFPIRDRHGRVVSFGGRMLGPNQPKYVNGPETLVFSKRRTLYGLDVAQEGVRKGGTLIVVEGYMDVIAAVQAGFPAAVAPMGTALTSEQLEELWRVSPCPVVCFDGDAAGARAASRVMELALPMLTPERSLRFASLPAGEDPDSVVLKGGAGEFQNYLDIAKSPVDALYDLLRDEVGDATPELRAKLSARLIEAADRVADKSLAWEYRRAIIQKLKVSRAKSYGAYSQTHRGLRSLGQWPKAAASGGIPKGQLHQKGTLPERTLILTAILLRQPAILPDVSAAYASLLMEERLDRLRKAILSWQETAESLDSAALMDHLTKSGFDADVKHALAGCVGALPDRAAHGTMPAEAEKRWWHFFCFLNIDRLREDVRLAAAQNAGNTTPENQKRLIALKIALARSSSGELDDGGLE
jgi:DNA primase